MTKEPIYCALAFGAISVHSGQKYFPCCGIDTNNWSNPPDITKKPKELINSQPLMDLRKELITGNWPTPCTNCKKSEESGSASMRNIWNRTYEGNYDEPLPMTEVLDPKNIFYSDFTFSTKCNSKCLTCGPSSSDFWEGEWNHIWKDKYPIFFEKPMTREERVSIPESMVEDILEICPNSKFMSFIGGEPTITDEHTKFLELLVEQDRSKNIHLSYVTNLTGITPELIELWRNFSSIRASVSVDGYGKVNEYIRYPFKWSKIEANMRQCFNLTKETRNEPNTFELGTGLSCTLSVFNVNDFPNLLECWYELIKEYFDQMDFGGNGRVFINRVTHPTHMAPKLLRNEYRQIGIDKINILREKIIKESVDYPNIIPRSQILDTINLYISIMEEPHVYNKEEIDILKHFITETDKFRNRNIKDYIPELWDELEKM
jgi:hypothetical protein